MPSPHEALDRAMDTRRLDLDLNWNDVAAAARISVATLRAIRSGANRPAPLTKRRLEAALRWSSGSIDALLAGGEPTPVESARNRQSAQDRELSEIRRLAEDLAERARRLEEDRAAPDDRDAEAG